MSIRRDCRFFLRSFDAHFFVAVLPFEAVLHRIFPPYFFAGTRVTVNNSIFGGEMKPTNTTTPNYIGRFVGLCTSNYTININKSVYTPIYYKGTESDWNRLPIDLMGVADATRYYYDESESAANWWHYDENGNVVHA